MTQLGQSIYPTLEIADAKRHLEAAIRVGCRHLFTSLHLPEASVHDWHDVRRLLEEAARQGMHVAADVSRASLAQFGAAPDDLSPFRRLGLNTLRLDYGFSAAEMRRMLDNREFSFQINASTANEETLQELQRNGVDLTRLTAVHNFYPRPETGISLSFYREKNRLFKAYGLRTGAFVPSLKEPRAPIFAGLPTVEAHRRLSTRVAVAELVAEGLTDIVYFGDPAPDEDDWRAAERIAAGTIPLRVDWFEPLPEELKPLLAEVHTNPPDAAEQVIRSRLGRIFAVKNDILPSPRHTVERPAGSVTIDNVLYKRYAGELQITVADLPADERVNVLGRVIAEDRPLLKHIGPGVRYTFI